MPLTNDDYNNFARSLAKRVIERAKGLDEESRRLVRGRPSDYVLSGFLTPGGVAPAQQINEPAEASDGFARGDGSPADGSTDEQLSELLAQDLPRDSAYETR
jgi:hypothetical protein